MKTWNGQEFDVTDDASNCSFRCGSIQKAIN
jgi:hypothetical protein